MIWTKRILLALPFVIACTLTILVEFADHLHLRLERVAGFGFLFATPWAWLLDHLWTPTFQNHSVERMMGYLVILWVPAALYSASLWIVLRVYVRFAGR